MDDPYLEQQTGPFGNQILVQRDSLTNTPKHIWKVNATLADIGKTYQDINQQNASQVGKQFLAHFNQILGITPTQLETKIVRRGQHQQWHLKYQQTYQGVPVWRSYVSLHIEPSGYIRNIHSSAHPNITISTSPSITSQAAINTVLQDPSAATIDSMLIAESPSLLIYPEVIDSLIFHLVWKVRRQSKQPLTDVTFFVDANSGEIVRTINNILDYTTDGTIGFCYLPEHYYDPPVLYQAVANNTVRVIGYNILGQQTFSASDINGVI